MSGEVEEMRLKLVEAAREREVLRGEREQERERRRAGERELRQVSCSYRQPEDAVRPGGGEAECQQPGAGRAEQSGAQPDNIQPQEVITHSTCSLLPLPLLSLRPDILAP